MREGKSDRGFGRRDRDSNSSSGMGGGSWTPRYNDAPSTAPVKVGDELEVVIEAVGVKGDGIAKKDGFVLFIPNAKAGQKIKIRVTKVLRKVGFAEAVGGAGAAAPGTDAPASEAPAAAEQPAEAEPDAADSEDFGDESQG